MREAGLSAIKSFPYYRKHNDVAFRLNLPPQLRIHPVFHSSLLEPYQDSTIPGRIKQPPPPIELEDGPEYEVVAILDSKLVRIKLYYLVNWLGYNPNELTSVSSILVLNRSRCLVTSALFIVSPIPI